MISEEASRTEAQLIADGARVTDILNDAVFRAALDRVNKKHIEEWKRGDSVEVRETAWAKMRALEELLTELIVTQDAGKRAKHERDRRDAEETSRKAAEAARRKITGR